MALFIFSVSSGTNYGCSHFLQPIVAVATFAASSVAIFLKHCTIAILH